MEEILFESPSSTRGLFTLDSRRRSKPACVSVSAAAVQDTERALIVLYPHLQARAWTELCDAVNLYHLHPQVGNNLAADGFRDQLIKIEGLDTYSSKDVAWGVTKECPSKSVTNSRPTASATT